MATAHLRHAARKLAGDQRTHTAARFRLLPRLFHSDEVNHGAAGALRREEEALAAIQGKKEELYTMIADARKSEHRIGWRNRGLLWCLSAAAPGRLPRHLQRCTQKNHVADVRPYKAESASSKLMWFAATTALLLLSHRLRDKEAQDPEEEEESSKVAALGDVAVETAT